MALAKYNLKVMISNSNETHTNVIDKRQGSYVFETQNKPLIDVFLMKASVF